ncbi:MAG: hypothetical protein WEB06_16475 [Actinomycetota bacterium]
MRFVARVRDAAGLVPLGCEKAFNVCGFAGAGAPTTAQEEQTIYCWHEDEFQRSPDYVGVMDMGVKAWCSAEMNGLSAAGVAWYWDPGRGWEFIASIGEIG